MMYIEHTPLEGNLNYLLGQQETTRSAASVAGRKPRAVEAQPRFHGGVYDAITKFIAEIKQNRESEAEDAAATSQLPYLNGDHIVKPLTTSSAAVTVDASEEEPPYELVDVVYEDNEDCKDTTKEQNDTKPANHKVVTVIEGFQVELPADSDGEAIDDDTTYYTVNAESSALTSRREITFGIIPGITSTPVIQSKPSRPVPAAIPIHSLTNRTVHYSLTGPDCSIKLVPERPKHLILNGRCGPTRSSESGDEDGELGLDAYHKSQMGLDLLKKFRSFFNLDLPIQEKKRKRRCESSDSDNPPQQIKYRKVNNRFPKYVSSTLENDDLEAQHFYSFEQNFEPNWPKSFITQKSGAMAQRKPLHPTEPPKARKSMFAPPVVTHKAVKNASYADLEFSDDDEPELINGFGISSRDNFDGLGRSTGRVAHIPASRRSAESYKAAGKPPPPLIPTEMGNVLGGMLPPERRSTYAEVLMQNHKRPMASVGNVLGTGARAASSMSSSNASTSASARGFIGSIRTNPWANSQRSVLALERETEERRQYQELLNAVVPSIYDRNASKSDVTLRSRHAPNAVGTTGFNNLTSQRRLAEHSRATKQPHITSTIDLSCEDDDDEDVTFVNSMLLKRRPMRQRPKLNSLTENIDDDVTEFIDLSGEEDRTNVRKKPPAQLPYVEPVNSLQDKLRCLEPMNPDWLSNWMAKWSAINANHLAEVEKAKKLAKESTAQRIAAETEMHERMKAFQIVDPSYLVFDEFPEPDETPEFVEFTKQQQEKINAAVYGPADKVVVSKFNQSITRRDLHTLLGTNWLNDEVINFYMNLLTERGEKREELPSVYAMNTFFVQRLLQSGYSGVKRWTRKVDLFSKDIIPVPVHVGGVHWCMAIIHLSERSIKYYDSMGSPNPTVLKALEQYLKDESLEKCGKTFDTSDFEIESVRDVPRQMNGSDCGVFSCMFAEYITRNRPITFSQQNMEYFRSRMILEIVQGELLH